jgi:hypothetical protein
MGFEDVEWIYLAQVEQVPGSCKYGNGHSVFTKRGEFIY